MSTLQEYQAAYRAARREENKAYAKAYRQANAEALSASRRAAYAANRQVKIEASLKWQRENKAAVNAKNKAYKARKIQACPKWLTDTHKVQMLMFYECAQDMTAKTGVSFEVDHIIPLKGKDVSGLHVPWNLQVITGEENNKKNNKIRGL